MNIITKALDLIAHFFFTWQITYLTNEILVSKSQFILFSF